MCRWLPHTLFTTKAEYVALADVIKEVLFLRQVWRFMLPKVGKPCIPVFEDNQRVRGSRRRPLLLALTPSTSTCDTTSEPFHRRGAPDVPEPPTLGAQYPIRYNIWKKFVRATQPVLVCASPQNNIRVHIKSSQAVPHLRNSMGKQPLARTVHPLPWGDSSSENRLGEKIRRSSMCRPLFSMRIFKSISREVL